MFTGSKPDKDKPAPRPVSTNRSAAPSLIAANLVVTGNLQSEGEIQVDGRVEGDVSCDKVLVGEKAQIAGEIQAKEIIVRGEVNGLIKGGRVELARTARVIGDVWHESLAIEAGAYLDGHCRRNDADKGKVIEAAPKAAVKPAPVESSTSGSEPKSAALGN